jgi:hypothetical protein
MMLLAPDSKTRVFMPDGQGLSAVVADIHLFFREGLNYN